MAHEQRYPDPLYDTPGLAQKLKGDNPAARGPSPRTIERWRSQGRGPDFIRIGGRVAYRESAVERWLDRQTRSLDDGPSRTSGAGGR